MVTAGIVPNGVYQFRVRAENAIGWGALSLVTTMKAAATPKQMNPVTTSIDPVTGGCIISWIAPATGISNPIDSYIVEILEPFGK